MNNSLTRIRKVALLSFYIRSSNNENQNFDHLQLLISNFLHCWLYFMIHLRHVNYIDMIAIPDFTSGAMENWGLITFRETALLYNKRTGSSNAKRRVAMVVSHELAHMWFGNLGQRFQLKFSLFNSELDMILIIQSKIEIFALRIFI